jgi:dolichyl-phosphate-mannose--protein O-mannosyl transferase
MVKEDTPLFIVIFALLIAGVVLRAHHLGIPHELKWDETHYVDTARAYVAHRYAYNDHPPLSKLLIGASMALFGDNGTSWRLPSLLFGLGNFAFIAWAAWVVFRSRRAAWLAAAFVAADGFFIAYSRTALLDGMIVAFGVLAITLMLVGRNFWHMVLAGLFLGFATSFKLNGLAFVGTALAICAATKGLRRYTPLIAVIVVLVFYAQAAFTLWLVGRPHSIRAVIAENAGMIRHHLSYTVVHPMSSKWYTWFLPTRPIFLRRDVDVDGSIRALVTLGNPLLWWGSTLAVMAAAVVVVRTGFRRLWQQISQRLMQPWTPGADGEGAVGRVLGIEDRGGALFWILVAWAGPIVFWIPSLRDSYIYHFMPSYAFGLVLLAGLTDRLYRRFRVQTLTGILLVAVVTFFYAPIWSELPLTETALHARVIFPGWR